MTGTINPTLPVAGEPNSTADPKVIGSLKTLRDETNALLTSENKIPNSSLSQSKLTWYTPTVIATEEGRTNTAYGTLTTKDEITGVVVPANGFLLLGYSALWKMSASNTGKAAFFIGANQLKQHNAASAPVVQEAECLGAVFAGLSSGTLGLVNGSDGQSYVTTGMTLAPSPVGATPALAGGFTVVQRLAAGTYNVSVQYKINTGTITAKERVLSAWVLG